MRTGKLIVAAAALGLMLPAGAQAARSPLEAPMRLPSAAAARAAQADGAGWLLGARPSAASRAIAARFGAWAVHGLDGALVVRADRARAAAAALRAAGVLVFAERDRRYRRLSAPDAHPEAWARGAVVSPGLAWPAPGGVSIAIVDDLVDPASPDVGAQTTYLTDDRYLGEPHGTMVASAAAGAAGNGGVIGVLPGARLLSAPLPVEITCAAAAGAIMRAVEAEATVINLSFGGPPCYTLWRAVEIAFGTGRVVVAASGNTGEDANEVAFPAAYPHVLSIGAVGPDSRPVSFSTANDGVDLAAPGVGVPVAIPPVFDVEDGAHDGVTVADGTSFAAPMVSGAAAWVAAAHPDWGPGQVGDALRYSARDVGAGGYDAQTGWGVLSVDAALAASRPRLDPFEPNDSISSVDGRLFRGADPPIWRGHGSRSMRASVDEWEDPYDVYRIRSHGRTAFSVTVRPIFGDPDVAFYDPATRSLDQTRHIVTLSVRGTGRTDRISVKNTSRRTLGGYVVVRPAEDRHGNINADYRLTIRRVHYRR